VGKPAGRGSAHHSRNRHFSVGQQLDSISAGIGGEHRWALEDLLIKHLRLPGVDLESTKTLVDQRMLPDFAVQGRNPFTILINDT
jgi:hypothetical protein